MPPEVSRETKIIEVSFTNGFYFGKEFLLNDQQPLHQNKNKQIIPTILPTSNNNSPRNLRSQKLRNIYDLWISRDVCSIIGNDFSTNLLRSFLKVKEIRYMYLHKGYEHQEPSEGRRCPGTGDTSCCEAPRGCRELNLLLQTRAVSALNCWVILLAPTSFIIVTQSFHVFTFPWIW